MKKLSIAYFGTPYFSALFLEKLLNDPLLPIEVKLVVTQPDKPVGRKQIMTKSPVKIIAEKFKIPISNFQINSKFQISNFKKIDLALIFAYGHLIPKDMLTLPKFGFWCIHPSLLPKYRGPSPIAYPLMFGDEKTGVTLIQLDEKIDHGPIIAQEEMTIDPNDRRPDLEIKLTDLAFDLFKKTINTLIRNPLMMNTLNEQDHKNASFTKMLKKKDGFVAIENLNSPAGGSPEIIFNLFRGLYPWPGIWTMVKIKGQEKRLKITDVEYKDSLLILKKVQLEGKKEVDFATFNKAYKIF